MQTLQLLNDHFRLVQVVKCVLFDVVGRRLVENCPSSWFADFCGTVNNLPSQSRVFAFLPGGTKPLWSLPMCPHLWASLTDVTRSKTANTVTSMRATTVISKLTRRHQTLLSKVAICSRKFSSEPSDCRSSSSDWLVRTSLYACVGGHSDFNLSIFFCNLFPLVVVVCSRWVWSISPATVDQVGGNHRKDRE